MNRRTMQRHRRPTAPLLTILGMTLWLVSLGVRAEEPRDPFMFGPRDGQPQSASTTLVGVLWDPTHPLAIVGEQMIGVGDRIGGWQVVQIQPDGIVIQRDERRELLTPGNAIPSD